MFLLTDLHLVGVIGTAIALSALGFAASRRWSLRTPAGEVIMLVQKPMTPTLLAGAVLFGVGWALSGTCPGTALAQIGEGKLAALATFAGILIGAARREPSVPAAQRARAAELGPPQLKKLEKGAFLLPAPGREGVEFVTMKPKMLSRLLR